MTRRLSLVLAAVALAGLAVVGTGIAVVNGGAPGARPARPSGRTATAALATPSPGRDSLDAAITSAQQQLRTSPDDWVTWADLGAAYVQQARITVDPSYYPKAAGALQQSLRLHPAHNVDALVGLGALANAQHNFAVALDYARQAVAADPYDANAFGVMDDALTQLGDYTGATGAMQHMLDVLPEVSSFTRASYEFEEHGRFAQARYALERALSDAASPTDVAFCRYYLGELAFNAGNLSEAARQYALGLAADATYDPLLEGRAKVEAAQGDRVAAIRDYTSVVGRVPQPQYVIELGEFEQSIGDVGAAGQQYELLSTEESLFAANGVVDDLLPAQFEADHGDPKDAVRHARLEWGRRHSVLVADALAWALHADHLDAEAIGDAQLATRLGWRNAVFYFHQGMIELALGRRADAARDLAAALAINPHFSPLQAPVAASALRSLRAA